MNKRAAKWLLIAFVIKAVLFTYFHFNFLQNWPPKDIIGKIFMKSGDTDSYLVPVENLVNGKGYNRVVYREGKANTLFAERIPGFLPVYAPLYYFFGSETARALLVALQFILSVISVYLLAVTAEKLFSSRAAFYWCFFLYAVSSFVSIFDHYGFADSFGASSLVFSLYFFVLAKEKNYNIHWLLSGIFFCWAFFLKPVLAVCLLLFPLIDLLSSVRGESFSFLSFLKRTVVWASVSFLCLSAWTARNFTIFHQLVPLQYNNYDDRSIYGIELPDIRNLIIAWGEDIQPWAANSAGEWFFSKKTISNPHREHPFSANIFTPDYNLDSLILLREEHRKALNPDLDSSESDFYKQMTMERAQRYEVSFKKHKPLNYYFLSPVKLIAKFVFTKRINNLPFPPLSEMKWHQKAVKGFYLLFYYFIVLSGLAGMLLCVGKKKRAFPQLLAVLPLSLIIIMSGILGYIEHRYFVPVYPFFVVYSAYCLSCIFMRESRAA